MIAGIGHDIASLPRIGKLLGSRTAGRFVARILTAEERELAGAHAGTRLTEFVAGRFAAKEAVSKAFGCGIGSTLSFTDIGIVRDERGKPECRLTPAAWERLGFNPDRTAIHVSITHDESLASAFVIVERM